MAYIKNVHSLSHLIKSVLGNLLSIVNKNEKKANELYVVNYHGTQKKFIRNFQKQINYFKNHYTIIDPHQLTDFFNHKIINSSKPLLLLTFDDGIKNNLYAIEVLAKSNCKAMFFVVPNFVDTPHHNQKEYFINYIRPIINPAIDNQPEDFMAITWPEWQLIVSNGHCIGSHTTTHRLVATLSSIENSEYEILTSKQTIAKNLQVDKALVNAFCSINNTLESVSAKEFNLIKKNYTYHFTTLPGQNLSSSNPLFIKRSNIESHWLLGSVKYALAKWEFKRWDAKKALFESVISSSN